MFFRRILDTLLKWLRSSWIREPKGACEGRRSFFRVAAGLTVLAATAPSILFDPASSSGNLLTQAGALRTAGMTWVPLQERIFFRLLTGEMDPELLPSIPEAPDGTAIFWSKKT
jgi:hypothetical protein